MRSQLGSTHPPMAVATCRGRARVRSLAVLVLVGLAGSGVLTAGAADAAEERCPNEASRQGPSAALPECRVYEQVTPVNKGDALDLFLWDTELDGISAEPIPNERSFVAENGDAVLLKTRVTLAPNAGVGVASYVFSRGAGGWDMKPVVGPTAATQNAIADVYDPVNLSAVGFSDTAGSDADLFGGDPTALQESLLVGPVGGPYAPVWSGQGFDLLEKPEPKLVGGSEDLSEVILESEEHSLIPGGVAEGQVEGSRALYEWGGGALQLVNANSDGSLLSSCGARLGQGGTGGGNDAAHNAVSSDGTRIFFTAPDPNARGTGCWNPAASPQENPPEVYMREHQADGSQRTVEISLPETGVEITAENPLLPAAFVGASADGSRIFFVTKTQLTSDAVGHVPELYEYETEAGKLTLVSRGEAGGEGNIDFVGAVSSDGHAVYFTAFGDLAPGAEALNPGGPSAPVNLYRYDSEAPVGRRLEFVTTINAGDFPLRVQNVIGEENWATTPGAFGGVGAGRAYAMGPFAGAQWYTTADGGYLVFGSYRPITGFDNHHSPASPSCPNLLEESGLAQPLCMELFRYDAATGGIVCVSCAGGAPVDNATFARDAAGVSSEGSPRPISEDGSMVFFDTLNVLVPQARPGHAHVYEWHEGAISLISAPGDPGNAFFLGSGADGRNVFFSTHAQLAPADTDQATDIYDARVDGGFEGVAPPACTGTGCQGVPAAAPLFATPPSATFAGVGNFPPSAPAVKHAAKPRPKAKKCRRGQVRKHGRCMRRPSKPAKGRK